MSLMCHVKQIKIKFVGLVFLVSKYVPFFPHTICEWNLLVLILIILFTSFFFLTVRKLFSSIETWAFWKCKPQVPRIACSFLNLLHPSNITLGEVGVKHILSEAGIYPNEAGIYPNEKIMAYRSLIYALHLGVSIIDSV